MIVLGLLLGTGISAMADTTWILQDIAFDNGNTATGWFTTTRSTAWWNLGVWEIGDFSIEVSGPASSAAFTAATMVDSYLPGTIGFANSGWTEFVDLYLTSSLATAPSGGDSIPVKGGFDCPGCGTVLLPSSGHNPEVVNAPELGFYEASALYMSGLLGFAFRSRRRV